MLRTEIFFSARARVAVAQEQKCRSIALRILITRKSAALKPSSPSLPVLRMQILKAFRLLLATIGSLLSAL